MATQSPVFALIPMTINGKTTGATLIDTSSPGVKFVPTHLSIEIMTVSGLAVLTTLSVGTNASSYNNIKAAAILTSISAVGDTLLIPLTSSVSIAGGTDIYVNVTIAATATTLTLRVSIIGFYY